MTRSMLESNQQPSDFQPVSAAMPHHPRTPSFYSESSDSSRHMLCESYCRCEYREATVAHTDTVKSFSASGSFGAVSCSPTLSKTVRLLLHDSTTSVDTKSFL